MIFSQVMAQFLQEMPDEVDIFVPEHWGQGRAVFGGMAVALAMQHIANEIPSTCVLPSVSVSFVAPLNAGIATIRRRLLRRGSSVIQMHVEILQQNQSMFVMLASFGAARSSAYAIDSEKAPNWSSNLNLILPKTNLHPSLRLISIT